MKNTIKKWFYNQVSGLHTICSANYHYYQNEKYGNYHPIWKFYKYWYDILTKIINSKILDYDYSKPKKTLENLEYYK